MMDGTKNRLLGLDLYQGSILRAGFCRGALLMAYLLVAYLLIAVALGRGEVFAQTGQGMPGRPASDLESIESGQELTVKRDKAPEGSSSETLIWESTAIDEEEVPDVDSLVGIVKVEDIVQPSSGYHYASFGRGDPFVPPMHASPKATRDEVPIVSILQNHDLGSLRVVGLWKMVTGDRKGLVMTPDGEGVIVRLGDFAGSSGGKISEIRDDHIVVREFSYTADGTRQFTDTALKLGGNDDPGEAEKTASRDGDSVRPHTETEKL